MKAGANSTLRIKPQSRRIIGLLNGPEEHHRVRVHSKQQSAKEMNTDLKNSSVELVFKIDYLPLNRMTGKGQVDRIKVNTDQSRRRGKGRESGPTGAVARGACDRFARESGLDAALKPSSASAAPAAAAREPTLRNSRTKQAVQVLPVPRVTLKQSEFPRSGIATRFSLT
jgi:hypothetical protein